MIKQNILGFVLIKQVNLESKTIEVLLPTEAPMMSNIGLISDAVFMDDVIHRI
jgi:hypothetical protein